MRDLALALLVFIGVGDLAIAIPCGDLMTSKSFEIIQVEIINNEKDLLVPVFSDVHGNLDSLFRSIVTLQTKYKRFFPMVLVTGDMGFYPFPEDLDPLFISKEIRSKGERGIADFYSNDAIYRKYFVNAKGFKKLKTRIYFIRGNHEDQHFLNRFRRSGFTGPVSPDDIHDVLRFLPDGTFFQVKASSGHQFTVAAFGGIHKDTRPKAYKRDSLIAFEDIASIELAVKLEEKQIRPDILLTHQGVAEAPGGHEEVDELIEVIQPKINLHGHGHQKVGPLKVGSTLSYQVPGLADNLSPREIDSAHLMLVIETGKILVK